MSNSLIDNLYRGIQGYQMQIEELQSRVGRYERWLTQLTEENKKLHEKIELL